MATRVLPVGGIAIFLALAGFLLLGGSDSSEPTGLTGASFYLEAEVDVYATGAGGGRELEGHTTIRWWYLRPGFWRWQIESNELTEPARTLIAVGDGWTAWLYDSSTNTYKKTAVKDFPGNDPPALPISVYLGPVSLSELTRRWEQAGISVKRRGQDRLLGFETTIMEYAPTWRASGSRGETSGGIALLWVDEQSQFVLRSVVDGGPGLEYVDAKVTRLERPPSPAAALFHFEPPAGSREEQ